jgi:hypothetical protein
MQEVTYVERENKFSCTVQSYAIDLPLCESYVYHYCHYLYCGCTILITYVICTAHSEVHDA